MRVGVYTCEVALKGTLGCVCRPERSQGNTIVGSGSATGKREKPHSSSRTRQKGCFERFTIGESNGLPQPGPRHRCLPRQASRRRRRSCRGARTGRSRSPPSSTPASWRSCPSSATCGATWCRSPVRRPRLAVLLAGWVGSVGTRPPGGGFCVCLGASLSRDHGCP